MKVFCDAHLHFSHCKATDFEPDEGYLCVSSCHFPEEFIFAEERKILCSYGIHPQIVNGDYFQHDFEAAFYFLEDLCLKKKICAVGECGFDFYTPEYKSAAVWQEVVFERQALLAENYGLPLVLHLRKSVQKIFAYTKILSQLPAVIFHSFPGTVMEADSFLRRGVKAYFSFGKPLLKGKKSAIDCVEKLPLQNLLLETDAPYQTLKGESETFPSDIKYVYQKACDLRKISLDEMSRQIESNFKSAFCLGENFL